MYVQARSASAKYWLRNYPHIWCYLCVFIRLANPLIFGFLFAPHSWFGGIRTSAMFACMRSHTTRNLNDRCTRDGLNSMSKAHTIKSWKKNRKSEVFLGQNQQSVLGQWSYRSEYESAEWAFSIIVWFISWFLCCS